MSRKNVLFISHDASCTGAPMVLLHLLRWLKARTDLSFSVLLRAADGRLLPAFQALAPTFAYDGFCGSESGASGPLSRSILERVRHRIGRFSIKRSLVEEEFGLIYSNTVVNGDVLDFLADLHAPILTHVHELEYCMRTYVGLHSVAQVRKHTRHYLAASRAVRDNLIKSHAIPPHQIDVIHEFIPVDPTMSTGLPDERRCIREQLGIAPGELVVCGSGTTGWRKGTDLFVQLAGLVQKRLRGRPVHFIWVGGSQYDRPTIDAQFDLDKSGAKEWTRFLGHVDDPLSYYAASDVFVLVSREDPYPLVMLEAASLGKPIVCFDGSGGAVEFVEHDCGRVVPYLHLDEMADTVVDLLMDDSLRCQLGRRGAEKVIERHTVDKTAPQILDVIDRFLMA